jgi:hypothetical protein
MNGNDKVTGTEGLEERLAPSPEMSLISLPERGISIEKDLAELEKNIQFFNRIKVIALKLTKPSDWVDMGGQPYLMDRGTENVAIAFGVDISDLKLSMEWAEDTRGRYYAFTATGKAYSRKLGRYVEDIGVCSQRDKFFGMFGKEFKEIQDVDMANIRRKAVTNLYNRLIKRVIGLMGVTFDDLAQAGISREGIGKVEYKGGAQKGAANLPAEALKKRDEIWKWLMECADGDEAQASKFLEQISYFKDDEGKDHKLSDIKSLVSEKWIASLHKKAKTFYDKAMAVFQEKG